MGRERDLEERGVKRTADPENYVTPVGAAEYRKAQIQERIRRYSSSCGCELASMFMLGALVLFLIHIAHGPAEFSLGEAAWRGFVQVLSATVLGKLLGLTYARVRLHMLRAALRKEFPASATPDTPLRHALADLRGRVFLFPAPDESGGDRWP